MERAAEFLRLSPSEFESRYVYRTKNQRRLRVPRDASCTFLGADGCSIHPAKPLQCRIFPFWPELLEDKREWKRTARWCPGIGHGELIQIETARDLAQQMRDAYPRMYP